MIEITKLADTQTLSQMFKALSNENRLQIFNLVREGVGECCPAGDFADTGSCVCDIADGVNLALSTVSHHLKELRQAGLINCEKRGQWVFCVANPQALEMLADFLTEED